jgi:hypothetical protein
MAKKATTKAAKGKPADQHKSGFMVRLPEAYRPLMKRVKTEHGQPHTVAVVRALNDYMRKLGIEPPATST